MKIETLLQTGARVSCKVKFAQRELEGTPEWDKLQVLKSELNMVKAMINNSLKHVTSTTRTFRAEHEGVKTSAYHSRGALDGKKLEALARNLGATDKQIEACRKSSAWKVKLS